MYIPEMWWISVIHCMFSYFLMREKKAELRSLCERNCPFLQRNIALTSIALVSEEAA